MDSEKGSYLFLLGVDDPEMRRISHILSVGVPRKHQAIGVVWSPLCKKEYAKVKGMPVNPGNAYQADSPPDYVIESLREKLPARLVCIECAPKEIPKEISEVIMIDHHRPGDPGFDLPPEQYWKASSIGQFYTLLGSFDSFFLKVPDEDKILAAMDHCLPAARQGRCPDVTPQDVSEARVNHIAMACNVSLSFVFKTKDALARKIAGCPADVIGVERVRDFTDHHLGVGYSLEYLCAQEVSADINQPLLLRSKDANDGPDKIILYGAAPTTVTAFLTGYAPEKGLLRIYGSPERGYAGGYLA